LGEQTATSSDVQARRSDCSNSIETARLVCVSIHLHEEYHGKKQIRFLLLSLNTPAMNHERPTHIATTQRVPEINIVHPIPPRAHYEPEESEQQAGPAAPLANVEKSPCSICMNAEVDCIYLYCGQAGSCLSYAQFWIHEARSCPVCREECSRARKTFASSKGVGR
jgi:hypothetical protein